MVKYEYVYEMSSYKSLKIYFIELLCYLLCSPENICNHREVNVTHKRRWAWRSPSLVRTSHTCLHCTATASHCTSGDLKVMTPDSKIHGANMGPIWVLSAPDGPHVGPMNFTILDVIERFSQRLEIHKWTRSRFISIYQLSIGQRTFSKFVLRLF